MKTVTATLVIEVLVDCPVCDRLIDILREADTDGYDHNDEGHVIEQACPDGNWYDKHKKFSVSDVTCSLCKESFNVNGLEW